MPVELFLGVKWCSYLVENVWLSLGLEKGWVMVWLSEERVWLSLGENESSVKTP